jgi:hypothetical protein
MRSSECLDGWGGGGCGVFIAPNHQFNRWGTLLSMGAPDSPMRQPCHPTARVLTVSTVGALSSGGPDSPMPHRTSTVHCPVRLLATALALRELSAHCSFCRRPLEPNVALTSRCSTVAPDSPVAHWTVR